MVQFGNIFELLKDRRDYMSQGMTPCTILQQVSDIHVTAYVVKIYSERM
jgi:hypothetical protein